mgnify:CR=1 FL=1|jgi:hypothetical protein|tara:strand:+ start:1228 stop:1557 length:330 start_codon:yes stop_codon:yes gene_type:complete
MALYNQPNLTDGIDQALVDVAIAVPSFVPMFLIFIYATIFIGGAISQKRRTGFADIPMWATISAISTLMISLPMTIISGMLDIDVLALIVTITIASGVWLFLDRRNTEI